MNIDSFRGIIANYLRYRKIRRNIAKVYYRKLIKASLFLSIVPAITIAILFVYERLTIGEGLLTFIAVFFGSTFFAKPYLSDLSSLTNYVEQLALDRRADAPPLSFLGNVEELSHAVKNLHHSWGERKIKLEAALAESKILFDTLPDILLMLDEDFNILRANNAALISLGKSAVNNNISKVIKDEKFLEAIKEVADSGQTNNFETSVSKRNITRDYAVTFEKFPIHSAGGISIVVVMHDITEAKKTKQMMKDFIANASHEIRTPLTSVIGFIETLQTVGKDDEKARETFLKIMAEQAEHMSILVNDLLSLSKAEMKENTAPTDIVDITDAIKSAINGSEWNAKKKNMTISLDADAILPELIGDTHELTQVFTNLISNAIKYGEAKTNIEISAGVCGNQPKAPKALPNEESSIYVSVKNYGEGIPKDQLSRVTERFFRVDKVRSRQIGGAGIGLAIVKHILNRHRGTIEVESTQNRYTIFTVKLPTTQQSQT